LGLRAGISALPDRRHNAAVWLQRQEQPLDARGEQRQGGRRAVSRQAQGAGGGQRNDHGRAAEPPQRKPRLPTAQLGAGRQQRPPHLRPVQRNPTLHLPLPLPLLIYSPNMNRKKIAK